MPRVSPIRAKWRPSMALVVALVCGALISVPLVAALAAQLTSNQFVRQTEQSLIKQGAIYAELYRAAFEAAGGPAIGPELDAAGRRFWEADLTPVRAQIDVRTAPVLAPVGGGAAAAAYTDPRHVEILPKLAGIARAAGKSTLAGVIFLDHQGRGLGEAGLRSFADLTEVRTALTGRVGAALRMRGDAYERHPFASLSRDTGFRVFLAYPVVAKDRVIGAVLLSRTPLNLGSFVFEERWAILIMTGATVAGAALIGALLLRLLSRPVKALRNEARAIASGEKPSPQPLAHYGMRELAELGDSVLSMADTLSQRSRQISTYTDHVTHELKSPVTSIIGAAELLDSDGLAAIDREKLLGNIRTEAARMNTLLGQLREIARLKLAERSGPGRLADMRPEIDGLDIVIEDGSDAELPLSTAHGEIVLLHMAQNARAHGAHTLWLRAADGVLRVADDGAGLSEADAHRLADPFFTTRREQGGTGMGLAIVAAILESYGATLEPRPNQAGAVFEIVF